MREYLKVKTRLQWFCLIGIIAVLFYFLHVWIGRLHYPGYDWLSQAVSDLTADSAPSAKIAKFLVRIYSLLSVIFSIIVILFIKSKLNKILRIGIYTFCTMNFISAIGYTLFPLTESGFAGTFQDYMHIVVTAIVVLLTISSFVLILIGFLKTDHYKIYGYITLVSLILLFIGSFSLNMVEKAYFGVFERISVYTVVLYPLVIISFIFFYEEKNPQKISANFLKKKIDVN